MAPAGNGSAQYVKLEQRLVLLAWLNSLFGYEKNRDKYCVSDERDHA